MRIGLASRWFAEGTSLAEAARRTRDLGLDLLSMAHPGTVEGKGAMREDAKGVGVEVGAVFANGGGGASAENDAGFAAVVTQASALAASLRAPFVVVEGGGFGATADRALRKADRRLVSAGRLGEDPDAAAEVGRLHGEMREQAAERAVRALHQVARGGASLAVRHGGSAACLLGFEELEWVLDDLPALSLFFDPARALRRHRLGLGPEPAAWAERFARRTAGVIVQGLASDLAGGSHPEDGAAPWRELAEALPRGVPWFLDLAPTLAAADVEDAVRYLQTEIGRGGKGGLR